jgi:hypothetical protein
MQLNVFVTDQGDGTGPIVFVPDDPGSVLPKNPRALEWRYFATVMVDDHLLALDREVALAEIERRGYYLADRMI